MKTALPVSPPFTGCSLHFMATFLFSPWPHPGTVSWGTISHSFLFCHIGLCGKSICSVGFKCFWRPHTAKWIFIGSMYLYVLSRIFHIYIAYLIRIPSFTQPSVKSFSFLVKLIPHGPSPSMMAPFQLLGQNTLSFTPWFLSHLTYHLGQRFYLPLKILNVNNYLILQPNS